MTHLENVRCQAHISKDSSTTATKGDRYTKIEYYRYWVGRYRRCKALTCQLLTGAWLGVDNSDGGYCKGRNYATCTARSDRKQKKSKRMWIACPWFYHACHACGCCSYKFTMERRTRGPCGIGPDLRTSCLHQPADSWGGRSGPKLLAGRRQEE